MVQKKIQQKIRQDNVILCLITMIIYMEHGIKAPEAAPKIRQKTRGKKIL